jgi:5-(carboxyamino)imidazole ribonucleotide mutase
VASWDSLKGKHFNLRDSLMTILRYLLVLLPFCNHLYSTPKIEVRVGSDSDLPRIQEVFFILDQLDIDYELRILSAHRTPHEMMAKALTLAEEGFSVCIGSAGGSAHLPGMTASETLIPVIALPVKTSYLDGLDSLLSMIQMPPGIPNGALGINQSRSAAFAAAQIAYIGDHQVIQKICKLRNIPYKEHTPQSRVAVVGSKQKNLGIDFEKAMELFQTFNVEAIEYDINEEGFLSQAIESGCSALYFICDIQNEGIVQCQHLAKSTFLPFIVVPYFESKISVSPMFFHQILSNEATLSMGINQFSNGALYCLQIIGNENAFVRNKFNEYRRDLSDSVKQKNKKLQEEKAQNGTYLKSWVSSR